MRKTVVLLGLLLLFTPALWAKGFADDFAFLSSLPSYQAFLDAAKHDGDARKAEAMQERFASLDLSDEQASVLFIRSSVTLARLYAEQKDANKEQALALLAEAERELSKLDEDGFYHVMLSGEIDGIHYLVNPRNLSKGIRSNAAIKEAYKAFPEQITAVLAKANSLVYAPAFAGGDVDKALSLYLLLLDEAGSQLSKWDRASIYSGIGVVAMKRKEWETAKQYFLATKALYPFDPAIDAYLSEVEEKL